jgi:uncharacterized flavoprotein (TIGR03862 family)
MTEAATGNLPAKGSPPTAVVVGGGPGGLMTAEVLATAGFDVTVVEHMASVGRKFLLAGRSGLNLTHDESLDKFLTRYRPTDPRLEAAIRGFTPDDLTAWAQGLGQPTFVGSSGRVFPEAFRATPLLRSWLTRLDELNVKMLTRHRWLGFGESSTEIHVCATTTDLTETITLKPDVVILALGGASWPRVGSDGTWVELLRDAGIEVADLTASNAGVAIHWTAEFRTRWAGTPLKNLAVSVGSQQIRGDLMITDRGLEGGPIYALNSQIRTQIAQHGRAVVRINLHPDLTVEQISDRWSRRRSSDSTSTALRRSLGYEPVRVAWLREVTSAALATDPHQLASLLTAVPVEVAALAPIDRAISSAGGVTLDAVNSGFMIRSRPGVYVVGEMLDWDAPTGGYLLQATFSTAVAAARDAISRHTARMPDDPCVNNAPDEGDYVHVTEGDRLWRFERGFLSSNWTCIWGRGCLGIQTTPDAESGHGCCSWGAQMDTADEAMTLSAMAAMIPEHLFQHKQLADRDGIFSDETRTNTKVTDGACIFLNRPGFEGGAGCALHLAAVEAQEPPMDWKPSVCWQLPIKVDWELTANDEQGAGIAEVATVRGWQRKDWGEDGATMAWCCTEGPEAYVGEVPVIESLGAEIAEIVGETVWVELRKKWDSQFPPTSWGDARVQDLSHVDP